MHPLLLPVALLAGGGAGFGWWLGRRPANSGREDTPEASIPMTAVDAPELLAALGWPYFYGRGGPATPWSDGPLGVDCSGFAQMALVKLGLLSASASDRGAKALADGSTPVPLGSQRPGDLAYYPGHVMVVCGQAGTGGHSPVIGASGGTRTTLGQDPNARIKTFTSGAYRKDFVTYMRLK